MEIPSETMKLIKLINKAVLTYFTTTKIIKLYKLSRMIRIQSERTEKYYKRLLNKDKEAIIEDILFPPDEVKKPE